MTEDPAQHVCVVRFEVRMDNPHPESFGLVRQEVPGLGVDLCPYPTGVCQCGKRWGIRIRDYGDTLQAVYDPTEQEEPK